MGITHLEATSSTELTATISDGSTITFTKSATPTISDDAQGVILALKEISEKLTQINNKLK